ncbi:insulinase family protein [Vibrio mimicus]|nr:insulinase family protein [Vibrio mimicus]QXC58909.1 insulinase family protein [Vibrio mimicus]
MKIFDQVWQRELYPAGFIHWHSSAQTDETTVQVEQEGLCASILIRTPILDDSGISHALEHMLLKGNYREPSPYTFWQLRSQLKLTEFNASTRCDKTCFHLSGTEPQAALKGLDYLLCSVLAPLLQPHDFDSEVYCAFPCDSGVVYHELLGYEQSLQHQLALQLATYRKQPPYSGTSTTIKSLRYQDLIEYYRHHYQPKQMVLVTSGAWDLAAVHHLIESALSIHQAWFTHPHPNTPTLSPHHPSAEQSDLKPKPHGHIRLEDLPASSCLTPYPQHVNEQNFTDSEWQWANIHAENRLIQQWGKDLVRHYQRFFQSVGMNWMQRPDWFPNQQPWIKAEFSVLMTEEIQTRRTISSRIDGEFELLERHECANQVLLTYAIPNRGHALLKQAKRVMTLTDNCTLAIFDWPSTRPVKPTDLCTQHRSLTLHQTMRPNPPFIQNILPSHVPIPLAAGFCEWLQQHPHILTLRNSGQCYTISIRYHVESHTLILQPIFASEPIPLTQDLYAWLSSLQAYAWEDELPKLAAMAQVWLTKHYCKNLSSTSLSQYAHLNPLFEDLHFEKTMVEELVEVWLLEETCH